MPKRALVLIDIQNDYFPGGKWTLSGIDAAADNAARVLAAARAAGDLVVHVRHEFKAADAPFFAPGSDGANIHPKVKSLEGEPVVLKHHVNAFRETDLKALLDRHGVEEVVICGAMSHMCVDAGTRAASDLGYKCVVVHDACATRDQEFEGAVVPAAQVHAAFMAALKFGYATSFSTEEYLAKHAASGIK
jgi:nicotinamidase-related amidase